MDVSRRGLTLSTAGAGLTAVGSGVNAFSNGAANVNTPLLVLFILALLIFIIGAGLLLKRAKK